MKFKIVHIEIDNFFSFKQSKFENISDYNVIIGKNNSGKSNLFKILEIIKNDFSTSKNDYDSSILFDSDENIKAKLSITFKLSREYKNEIFEEFYNHNYFKGILPQFFEKSEGESKDRFRMIFINHGMLDAVKILFCYNDPIRNLTLNKISILSEDLKEENVIFITEKTQHGPQYFTFESKHFQNAINLNQFFDFSINKDLGEPYDSKNLYNLLNMRARKIIQDNRLVLKILNDIILKLPNLLEFVPSYRQFKDVDDISDIDANSLLLNGGNLGKFIYLKENNEKIWMTELNKELREFFPKLDILSQNVRGLETVHYYKERGLQMPIRYKNKGSGIMQIALFLMFLNNYKKEKILFIEEPELYIFPGLQKKLMRKFLDLSNYFQFFINTHSSYFISKKDKNSSTFLIKKEKNESIIENISKNNLQKIFSELEISPFDYLLYDGYILVEGKDDKLFIKKVLEKFSNLKLKIIKMRGKRNFQYYVNQEILDSLNINKINFVYFLDKDRDNEKFLLNIGNNRVKEIVKERSIFTPYYELENFFLNPVFLFDFLISKSKNKINYPVDFQHIIDFLPNLFEQQGEDLRYEYIIKRLNEEYQLEMKSQDLEDILILPKIENCKSKEEVFNYWANEFIPSFLSRHSNKAFRFVETYDTDSIISKLETINTQYNWELEDKNFNQIIPGKEVFKKINKEFESKYGIQLSKPILIDHLNDLIVDYRKYLKKEDLKNKIESSLNSSILQKFKELLSDIVKIIMKFQEKLNFTILYNLSEIGFENIEIFLKTRWKI